MGYRFIKAERERLLALPCFIEENLSKELTMRKMCMEAQMSYEKLNAGFHELFSKSILQYIIDRRMKKAEGLLIETDMTIKQIAGDCGYRNVKSFHRVFYKFHHRTPSSVRRAGTAT